MEKELLDNMNKPESQYMNSALYKKLCSYKDTFKIEHLFQHLCTFLMHYDDKELLFINKHEVMCLHITSKHEINDLKDAETRKKVIKISELIHNDAIRRTNNNINENRQKNLQIWLPQPIDVYHLLHQVSLNEILIKHIAKYNKTNDLWEVKFYMNINNQNKTNKYKPHNIGRKRSGNSIISNTSIPSKRRKLGIKFIKPTLINLVENDSDISIE